MYAPDCQTRSIPREAARGLLWVSLFYAISMLAAAWLRAGGLLPGIDVALMMVASVTAGWALDRRAYVRGLPLVAGVVSAAVALGEATLGDPLHGASGSGGAMFVALLLSTGVRSWRVGLTSIAILTAAVVLAWLT